MGLIDFILNLASLLLWVNWRSMALDPLNRATPATLAGTLRRAEPPRLKGWHFPAALGGLILLRAVLYWQIGSAANWTANLDLVAISIPLRSDFFGRMLLFSLGSFCLTLAVFLFGLLFLSLVNPRTAKAEPVQRLVRLQLGWPDGWPRSVRCLLPFVTGFLAWWVSSWPLAYGELIPPPVSAVHRIEQSVLIGLGAYLAWKYLIVAVLAIHLVHSYLYLGNHAAWDYGDALARILLKPLRGVPLRVGRLDFAPLAGIVLVLLAAMLAEMALAALYRRLPM